MKPSHSGGGAGLHQPSGCRDMTWIAPHATLQITCIHACALAWISRIMMKISEICPGQNLDFSMKLVVTRCVQAASRFNWSPICMVQKKVLSRQALHSITIAQNNLQLFIWYCCSAVAVIATRSARCDFHCNNQFTICCTALGLYAYHTWFAS